MYTWVLILLLVIDCLVRRCFLLLFFLWEDALPFPGLLGALLDVWGLLCWLKEWYEPPCCRAE